MEKSFFAVAKTGWVLKEPPNPKRVGRQRLYPLGNSVAHLEPGCDVLVKFRAKDGQLVTDGEGEIREYKGSYYLRSVELCEFVQDLSEEFVTAFFEGTPQEARCIVQPCDAVWFELLAAEDPSRRLAAFGLPPTDSVIVDNSVLVATLHRTFSSEDRELFAVHVSRFLDSPHILTPLFCHVLSLRSEDNLNFVIELKKIAEQIRMLLRDHGKSVGIQRMEKSHLDLWSEMEGSRVAFLDGGVARIPGVARLEPLALRVGVYGVVPGKRNLDNRETWFMQPYVIGDCVDPRHPIVENTDRRRLLEAARYTFEPLSALSFLNNLTDTRFFLLHGPLVNQFAMYDEGEPHHIPALDPEFLDRFGITKADVTSHILDIPDDPKGGGPFWNHFMSVYAHVMMEVQRHPNPIAGVVERVAGRAVTRAVLTALKEDRVVKQAYVKKIEGLLEQYDISDDFLFGCILREGEYVTPLPVDKNLVRRARDRWRPVVRQIPSPAATMIKTEDTAFPFRVEMNEAATTEADILTKLIFHTARLLPRYAFPVGLDIADKYAKVPDWIARGISGEMSAAVIRRALRTGDPQVIAQVRQLLAKTPRDFFFRPGAEI